MKARRIPAYVHHKPTGQARVRIGGKDHYLGKYGSRESHDRYDDLIAEYIDAEPKRATTITAILAAWWPECKRRYGNRGKGPFGNAVCWRPVIRLLRENFGQERAEDLGPIKLRSLIEREAKARNWSVSYAKMVLTRVRYIYRWAVSEEMISLEAFQKLETVELRIGRKTKKIPPVNLMVLARTLRHLPPKIAAMVRLQRLLGCRPAELVQMKASGIDRRGEVWTYSPAEHKTAHLGRNRTVYIGPRAQKLLAPWLIKAGDGYLFPSKGGRCYTSDSYRRAIQRICETHGIPMWAPNQLRKAGASRIRAAFDVEHAASILGHSSATVTGEHYAEADRRRAIEAARKIG